VDARKFQLEVDVVRAGVRGVDPAAEARVFAELERWGCRIV
jgi:nicotinamidase